MSKVIHLRNESHAKAKEYCKRNFLTMSDWVASLIDEAISPKNNKIIYPSDSNVSEIPEQEIIAPKNLKKLEKLVKKDISENELPSYMNPPFWEK